MKKITDIKINAAKEDFGLSKDEAASRLKEFGPNALPEKKPDSLFLIFLRQFKSPLIYILLAAAAAVLYIGETVDAVIIFAVLGFNAVVGTVQEGKAQNTLLALKRFASTYATVLRDGKETVISDTEVVPGDLILLSEGEKVPADAKIIEANGLKANEAALTGESEPVAKIVASSDKKGLLWKGTYIVAGNGKAVITATGVKTAIGKIAAQIASIETEIPLKANIRYLSRLIIGIAAGVGIAVFAAGVLAGQEILDILEVVISLTVSIVPEGLPIVMTLVLATGVWRMSKRNALVKKLQAVEALGQASVIAVDKTGTLTKNELTVERVFAGGKMFSVSGAGYEPKGKIKSEGKYIEPANHEELLLAGKVAAFCADARVVYIPEAKEWKVAGDPTEAAMLVLSQKIGFNKSDLISEMPLVGEIPFDYRLKYHAAAYANSHDKILAVAGAPEVILEHSNKIWKKGGSEKLLKKEKEELESILHKMSSEGLRVVALAKASDLPKNFNSKEIKNLVFVGFLGMKDALRPEVPEAMAKAAAAGIRVVMITGDYKVTAEAIAKEAGIYHSGDEILTGADIEKMSEKMLASKLYKTTVFARVTPEHKLKIIRAYKSRGEIVAMTGDGVNDAPPLVAADLGVAMGKIGTEVAKEAADIVLLDDNFGSIVSAVEEGRSIYKTIRKVILYLFSTSFGEIFTIAGALLLGLPLPILPAQIIWLNFVTDGFLDVSLAMEPKEEGLLNRHFERPKKYLIDKLMAWRMLIMALPMAAGTIYIFKDYAAGNIVKAWTMSLTLLAAFQWFNAWNCRSEEKSIFKNLLANKFLAVSTLIIIALQILAVYNPIMQKLLRTTALDIADWLVIVPIAATVVFVEELRKFITRQTA